MLLEFRASNYKSFKEEFVFSMTPAPKQKGLDYSLLTKKIGRKNYKALSTSIIYGPNAAGKTNIIGALETFKSIILRGNIKDSVGSNEQNNPNIAAFKLDLIPNLAYQEEALPVSFGIKFISENHLVDYSIIVDLGRFLHSKDKRKVIKEALSIDNYPIFTRQNNFVDIDDNCFKRFKSFISSDVQNNFALIERLANSVENEDLFLTNGLKNLVSSSLTNLVLKWLTEKLTVVCRADAITATPNLNISDQKPYIIEEDLTKAAQIFTGTDANAIGYMLGSEKAPRLCSFIKTGKNEGRILPAEIFESYGTVRFINTFLLIKKTLAKGGTLFVDEFDASIHPHVVMDMLNLFHNDELNENQAQLVFNSHNPIFLDGNLCRRDEIKFVEKNNDSEGSRLFSLSDFGTSGPNAVRKNEDFMRNYINNRYGAIRDTFSFEDLLKG